MTSKRNLPARDRLDEVAAVLAGQSDVGAVVPPATMLTVDDIARLLVCSPRTVYRLADASRLPPAVRFGALVRWPRAAIDAWMAEGCPAGRAVRPRRR